MFCLVKSYFCFSHDFQTWFHDAVIYCFIHRCLYSLFILLLFSYISFQEMGHRNNANPFLFKQLAKVQQNEWKMKPGVSEHGHWICN